MKKKYKPYFISSISLFALAIVLNIFQYYLVSDQVEMTVTIGTEKKEKFEKELWAFRTADKLFGWGVTVPRKNAAEACEALGIVRRDTNRNGCIILLMYAVSIALVIIGLFKKHKFNKTNSQDGVPPPPVP